MYTCYIIKKLISKVYIETNHVILPYFPTEFQRSNIYLKSMIFADARSFQLLKNITNPLFVIMLLKIFKCVLEKLKTRNILYS